MRKYIKRFVILAVAASALWGLGLARDARTLGQDILRLHVVGASDSAEDQAVKGKVRDAVLEELETGLANVRDIGQAKVYIQGELPSLTETANAVLAEAGFAERAAVTLTREEFPIREYDTFCLPSGVYNSLRIVIGEGEGKNWWCVVYPELCVPATSDGFVEAAAMDGMPDSLTGALAGDYEIRFWLLDKLGQLQNFLHRDSE